MNNLKQSILRFNPCNEQEEKDKALLLSYLDRQDDCMVRENKIAHFTASAWVVNETRDKVLMIYHNIYNSWSWLGGHADGETNLLKVAMKEVMEESGIRKVRPVTEEIFSLESLTVDGHMKKGAYVSSHLHLNVTYLLEASEEETLQIRPDENSGVAWFSLENAVEASTEPWFQEHVYKKLNDKLKNMVY